VHLGFFTAHLEKFGYMASVSTTWHPQPLYLIKKN